MTSGFNVGTDQGTATGPGVSALLLEVFRRRSLLGWLALAAISNGLASICGGLGLLGSGDLALVQFGNFCAATAYLIVLGVVGSFTWNIIIADPSTLSTARLDLRVLGFICTSFSLLSIGSLLQAFGGLGFQSTGLQRTGEGFSSLGLAVLIYSGLMIAGTISDATGGERSKRITWVFYVLVAATSARFAGITLSLQASLPLTANDYIEIYVLFAVSAALFAAAFLLSAAWRLAPPRLISGVGLGYAVTALGTFLAAMGFVGGTVNRAVLVTGLLLAGAGSILLAAVAISAAFIAAPLPPRSWTRGPAGPGGPPQGQRSYERAEASAGTTGDQARAMYCPHCGQPRAMSAKFCQSCGNQLS